MATAAIMKLLLAINLILVHLGAIVDYVALPHVVNRYAAPDTDHDRVNRIGRCSIALLVGVYTLAALFCHRSGSTTFALVLAAYLILDMSLSLRTWLKGRGE